MSLPEALGCPSVECNAAIDAQLGAFQGRIARDNLVDQASYLARGDKAGFEAQYGALGGEL